MPNVCYTTKNVFKTINRLLLTFCNTKDMCLKQARVALSLFNYFGNQETCLFKTSGRLLFKLIL